MAEHSDVKFRGKAINDLTREEAIEALKQALGQVKFLERRIPTVYEHQIQSGGHGANTSSVVYTHPYVLVKD